MYRVDGLIQYYFQRKIMGMDFSDIEKSLQEQQYLEEQDRETILKEIERKERMYHKRLLHRRISRALNITGLVFTLSSLVLFFLIYNNQLSYPSWPGWTLMGMGILAFSLAHFRTRLAQLNW